MSGRQARGARRIAHHQASHQNLWKQGESEIHEKWTRRLLARIFPSRRRNDMAIVGNWYKRTLKLWSKEAYARAHDPEYKAMMRARAKIMKH
jgi:hypothetical protein